MAPRNPATGIARRSTSAGERAASARTRDLASLVAGVVEPVLRRRAGLSMAVAASWPSIVGPELAGTTRPGRIRWGRRPAPGEPQAPGTLVVVCTGGAALSVQHQADQIVSRVNAAFGHEAIGRIRVERGEVGAESDTDDAGPRAAATREATPQERERSASLMRPIAHDRLREALSRLGERVVVANAASTSPSNFHDHTIASERAPNARGR